MKNKIRLTLIILALITTLRLGAEDVPSSSDESPLSAEHCTTLAHYHFEESKCYRKAMYWALKGAQNGSSDCMLMLRKAYGHGVGVIAETEESLKWLLLAAAIGNKQANDDIARLQTVQLTLLTVPNSEEVFKESRERWEEAGVRARNWVECHPKIFINEH